MYRYKTLPSNIVGAATEDDGGLAWFVSVAVETKRFNFDGAGSRQLVALSTDGRLTNSLKPVDSDRTSYKPTYPLQYS